MESMNESRSIRVIIADDQELVRAGFAMVIGSQQDMEVVAQASDGAEAVTMAETLHPDVVLMDVRMPGMDGIEATRRITSLTAGTDGTQPTRVIILTTFDLDEYVMAAINAGASGFLLKDTEPETLLNSIRTVFQGQCDHRAFGHQASHRENDAGRLCAAWVVEWRRFERKFQWQCWRRRRHYWNGRSYGCRFDERHWHRTPHIYRSRAETAHRSRT